MIFKRVTLHNSHRYRGENSIIFSAPGPGKASTKVLVLALNNSGKTTILRALRSLFYGRLAEYEMERLEQGQGSRLEGRHPHQPASPQRPRHRQRPLHLVHGGQPRPAVAGHRGGVKFSQKSRTCPCICPTPID